LVIGHAPPAAAQVEQKRAQEYFKEAQALCERGELLLHESFHIVQAQLVTNGPAEANEHLDAVERARPLHS
jgi:hypothetical protein